MSSIVFFVWCHIISMFTLYSQQLGIVLGFLRVLYNHLNMYSILTYGFHWRKVLGDLLTSLESSHSLKKIYYEIILVTPDDFLLLKIRSLYARYSETIPRTSENHERLRKRGKYV